MTVVVGRTGGPEEGALADLGTYSALDGSQGAPLALDIDHPHAVSVVGKRGYGKSYTLGVLAEELARTPGLAPVVVDPMGTFGTLQAGVVEDRMDAVPARVVEDPAVAPSALDPRSWCSLLGLAPETPAGGLVWQAAVAAGTLAGMAKEVRAADAPRVAVRAAVNHIDLAASWGVFDADGLDAPMLATGEVTVLDVSGLESGPMNAVARAVFDTLYRARVTDRVSRFPWLLVDEAHAFFEGVAADALERILTRGRAPGVSLALATQRPSALPGVAISQSDVLIAHRLTSRSDIDTLRDARPAAMETALLERMPEAPGEVVLVDDVTESIHTARVRHRHTPHGGGNPSVSEAFPR